MTGDVSPTGGARSPMTGDVSPASGARSPMTGDVSPTSGAWSLLTGDVSLTGGARSPMAGDVSLTGGARSLLTGDVSPTGGARSPMLKDAVWAVISPASGSAAKARRPFQEEECLQTKTRSRQQGCPAQKRQRAAAVRGLRLASPGRGCARWFLNKKTSKSS